MSANRDQAEIMRRVQKEYREKAEATRRARLDSERIEWKCDQCGKAEMRSPHARHRRFCGNECSQEFNRTARVMPKFSPAREKTAEVVALYRDGLKAKPIAIRFAISPRIVREILIEQGVYAPNNPGNGEESKPARLRNLYSAMMEVLRKASKREAQKETVGDLHAAMVRVVKRCNKPKALTWMEKYHSIPAMKVKHLLRKRIRTMVTRGDKSASTLALLGCTREQFMAHLESQFKKGMTWKNIGVGRGKWNIDHIIPCASFDMEKPEHQRRCFHYTNMQPMWAIANIRKSDTAPKSHQWLLA